MTLVIFVGGLLPFDSGKTILVSALIDSFSSYKKAVTPFKPLSGNNLYYNYAKIKKIALKYHNILSLDINDIIDSMSNKPKIDPTILNPVHQLHSPAIPYYFLKEKAMSVYFSQYSDSKPLIQRFTSFNEKEEIYHTLLINNKLYSSNKFLNDKDLLDEVIEASTIHYYNNENEYLSLNEKYYAHATATTFDRIKREYPIIVIEGYNNSAHPAWCVREANVILLVGPETLFVYEPEQYFMAIDNYHAINRNKPTTTDVVVKLLEPNFSLNLKIKKESFKESIDKLASDIYEKYF